MCFRSPNLRDRTGIRIQLICILALPSLFHHIRFVHGQVRVDIALVSFLLLGRERCTLGLRTLHLDLLCVMR